MAMVFNPPQGLLDTNYYVDQPSTGVAARGQIQDPLNQLRDYMNTYVMLKESITGSLDSNYIKIPLGSRTFMIQWGRSDGFSVADNNNAWRVDNFTIPFLNVNYVILPNVYSTTKRKRVH
jgi:hypothetical protein